MKRKNIAVALFMISLVLLSGCVALDSQTPSAGAENQPVPEPANLTTTEDTLGAIDYAMENI